MISVLIIWAFKKYDLATKAKFYVNEFLKFMRLHSKKIIYPLLFLFASNENLEAQTLQYAILKGSAKIGILNYSRNVVNNTVLYKAESKVTTRFIFSISVDDNEESFFKDGILQYSSIYRKVNGHINTNNQTQLSGDDYVIVDKKENETNKLSNYPITGCFLGLYYNEPANNTTLYSDTYKQLISIIKLGEHKYKVTLPDGNYNYYYYNKGICTRVEVVHSFYKIIFSLINNS
jgi:hypothetical protein